MGPPPGPSCRLWGNSQRWPPAQFDSGGTPRQDLRPVCFEEPGTVLISSRLLRRGSHRTGFHVADGQPLTPLTNSEYPCQKMYWTVPFRRNMWIRQAWNPSDLSTQAVPHLILQWTSPPFSRYC